MSSRRGADTSDTDAEQQHSAFVASLYSDASRNKIRELGLDLDVSQDSLEVDLTDYEMSGGGVEFGSPGLGVGRKTSMVEEGSDEENDGDDYDGWGCGEEKAEATLDERVPRAPSPPTRGRGVSGGGGMLRSMRRPPLSAGDDGAADAPPDLDRRTSSASRDRIANARRLQKRASVRAFVKTGQSTRNLGLGIGSGGGGIAMGGSMDSAEDRGGRGRGQGMPSSVAANDPSPSPSARNKPQRRSSLEDNLANLKELLDMGHIDGPTYEFLMEDMKASHRSSSGGGGGGGYSTHSSGGGGGGGSFSDSGHRGGGGGTPPPPDDIDRATSHGLADDLVVEQYRIQAQRDAAALVRRRLGFDPRKDDRDGKYKKDGGKDENSGGKKETKIISTDTRFPRMREGRALPSPRAIGAPPATGLGRRPYPLVARVSPAPTAAAEGEEDAAEMRKDGIHRERTDGIVVLDSSPANSNGGSGSTEGGGGGGSMSDALFASELSRLLAAGKVKLDDGERVVRCMSCRSGLKVGRGAALVNCPICGAVSPGTTEYGEESSRHHRPESV